MPASLKVRVEVDKAAVNDLLRGRTGAVGRIMAGYAGELTKDVKSRMVSAAGGSYWPVRSSIGSSGGELSAEITVGTTKPHIIVPVRAKVLAFDAGGVRVFTRKVYHPGSSAPVNIIQQTLSNAGSIFPPLSKY